MWDEPPELSALKAAVVLAAPAAPATALMVGAAGAHGGEHGQPPNRRRRGSGGCRSGGAAGTLTDARLRGGSETAGAHAGAPRTSAAAVVVAAAAASAPAVAAAAAAPAAAAGAHADTHGTGLGGGGEGGWGHGGGGATAAIARAEPVAKRYKRCENRACTRTVGIAATQCVCGTKFVNQSGNSAALTANMLNRIHYCWGNDPNESGLQGARLFAGSALLAVSNQFDQELVRRTGPKADAAVRAEATTVAAGAYPTRERPLAHADVVSYDRSGAGASHPAL